MVMGHSIKQWDKWYDMQYHPRMAQNAVDGMQSWRAAMLQSHTPAAAHLTLSTAAAKPSTHVKPKTLLSRLKR